ncbi:MAG: LD-carboxypeptidase [Sphingomonadales bacterium]|nr:LD-carboxypeptidase [Sphingomonadales bacterium]
MMMGRTMRIAVVAPSNTVPTDVPPRIHALAAARYGAKAPEIVFSPQCFLSEGHFAGSDEAREDALVEAANDPAIDAVWFGRGGYGANRIAENAIARMGEAAKGKPFLGYSDGGFILAGLLAQGVGRPVHGPMTADINRAGGDEAVARSLDWLIASDTGPSDHTPVAAFNLTVFSSLIGTALQPDMTGRILMLEEVDEPMYRIDRSLFHVTGNANVRKCAGLMLGRCAPITPNVPEFGKDEVALVKHWCAASGIDYLGRADIGHDADNTVVAFR